MCEMNGGNKMKKRLSTILVAAMMLLSACAPQSQQSGDSTQSQSSGSQGASSTAADAVDINFGAGAMGGNYYVIAGAMKVLAEDYCPAINSFTCQTGASNQFMAECQEGTIDMYMNTIDALYYGYAGTGQQGFPEGVKFDKSNFVTIMYNHTFLFLTLASNPINNLSEITGTVAVASATMQGLISDQLKACGVENPDVAVINDYNQLNQGLKDGTYEVIVHTGPGPQSFTMDLMSSTEIKVVSMTEEEVQKALSEGPDAALCQAFIIDPSPYDFMTEDYYTLGRGATISCSADLSEEAVYEFVKAIFEHRSDLETVYAPMNEMTIEAIQKAADDGVIKVPIHPGARRYYEEQGVVFPDSIPQ